MLERSKFVLFAFSILMPSLATAQVPQKPIAKAVGDTHSKKSFSPSSMSGPIQGLVFDHIHGGLRPILGFPGASTLGGVLEVGVSISRAWISPRRNCVLAEIKDNKEIALLDLSRDPLE